jgi:hypothetical protein
MVPNCSHATLNLSTTQKLRCAARINANTRGNTRGEKAEVKCPMWEILTGSYRSGRQHVAITTVRSRVASVQNVPPWSGALSEKLPVSKLLKNFPAFYGTRRSFAVFTRALHLSLSKARLIQSTPPHPISLISIIPLPRDSFLVAFSPKSYMHSFYCHCVLHDLPNPSSLTWSFCIFSKESKLWSSYLCSCL